MHFIINKDKLVHAIQHISKAVSTKTTIPILTGIKFEIEQKGLLLTGSDSDITIQIFIPTHELDKEVIKVFESGQLILPKYVVDIVKKLPNEEIEFKIVDHLSVIIKSGLSEFRLNGFDAEEYPSMPHISEDNLFSIQSSLLKTMIKQTIFAVSTVESRPILTGVLWQLKDNTLRFVATDSHRLAIRESMVDGGSDLSFNNIVVPGKALNELSQIIDDDQSNVEVIVTENQILFKIDHIIFLSRLLDGTYPDISRIIPENGKTMLTLKTKDLLESIERASLIAKDSKNNVVKLDILDNSMLEISSNLPEIGKVTEQVVAKEFEGEKVKISFNSKYMIDALKTVDSQEIIIEFTGALSPFVMKPVEEIKMLHLILPVRTS